AGGRELPGPEVLNVLGHELDELERRVVTLDRALPRRRRRIRKRIDRRHTSAATAAPGDQIDDQGNHQQPYAAAPCPADRNGKGQPAGALACLPAPVLDVPAARHALPAHGPHPRRSTSGALTAGPSSPPP